LIKLLEIEIFKIQKKCFEDEKKIQTIFEEIDKDKKGFYEKKSLKKLSF